MKKAEIKRREFLKLLFIPVFFNGEEKVAAAGLIKPSSHIQGGSGNACKACIEVFEQWGLRESVRPEVYFYSRMALYRLDSRRISSAAELDFQRGNLFEVNGMILGRTEASFIAYLGGQLR